MKKFNIFSLLTLLTLSVFLVGCGEKEEIKPENSGTQIQEQIQETDNEEIDTSNWQTYRNEELGFEIKYPEDQFDLGNEDIPRTFAFYRKGWRECEKKSTGSEILSCLSKESFILERREKSRGNVGEALEDYFNNIYSSKNLEEKIIVEGQVIDKIFISKDSSNEVKLIFVSGESYNYIFQSKKLGLIEQKMISTFKELN